MMRSAASVVEISSDDEDGRRALGAGNSNSTVGGWSTPSAGKHPPGLDGGRRTPGVAKDDKSSDGGLKCAEKLLDEDCDDANAIEEGLLDSAGMQEFWATLMDGPGVVADPKKNMVHEPEKKRPRDDDDDDCVILDGGPEEAVAVAKEEKTRRDSTEDELEIVAEKGEVACRDFPHPRHLCAKFSFNTSPHASHCSMCHCYVCDLPAPCAFWDKGAGINDHCHATDKDPMWRKLRQYSKSKSQETPKLNGVQNLLQSSSTTSTYSMVPSAERLSITNTASQIQQMHPSTVVSRNVGLGITRLSAPSLMSKTKIPSNGSKRVRIVPPVHAPSNVNSMQPFFPCYGLMQPAFPRGFHKAPVPPGSRRAVALGSQRAQIAPGFQRAQVAPESQRAHVAPGFQGGQVASGSQKAQYASGSERAHVASGSQITQVALGPQRAHVALGFQRAHVVSGSQRAQVALGSQRTQVASGFQTTQVPHHTAPPPLSAAKGSLPAILYPQMPANTVVGTGVPLSRCTSVSIQGKQQLQVPSNDTNRTLRDVLTYLAHELEVPDYNIDAPVDQQSSSTQTVHPNQLLAQEKACQERKN